MYSTTSCLVIILVLSGTAISKSIIKTLPGYTGDLPFNLETGYVSVGELDDVQLFYYFIESEGSPKEDPLMLWLTGGPGCSGFSGLVYEIGPLNFNTLDFDGNFPTFILNPYSWTKVASIIFLDAPVGTGFSYANNTESSSIMDDKISAAQTYQFFRKWLNDHSEFTSNDFYVGGDSYSGIVVPIIVQEIYKGNEVGRTPIIKLQGYILGNPLTSEHDDPNSRVEFAHRVALISDQLFKSAKTNCDGEYVNVDSNNTECVKDIEIITECIAQINRPQILEPTCSLKSPNSTTQIKWDRRFVGENPTDFLLLSSQQNSRLWCREYNYLLSYIWANDETVQEALHVREGTLKEWMRCNWGLAYTQTVLSSVAYHQYLLSNTNYRALIYSGDHDMLVPYVGTHAWIDALNLTISDDWKPWFVDGQVAGYSMAYYYYGYHLTYATVKGGGHTAPEYKPKECLAMLRRWFAYYPF
ncbi:serine carboxypeptidase-like 18 isoform X1 [Cornus florida]|uniref:serine carboxypeptidase-like 18 isoform X1 n=2 Tax=Cornus florida TaxID=4283 RepID=UPI00289763A8|nr:serine carboxypeptidase-like 18 isoform X1 [Cornus florida]